MKLLFHTLLLFFLACTISLMAQADSLCGDGGYYNAQLGICQGGSSGGTWTPGWGNQNSQQQHTPRDYFGAIAADVVTGKQSGYAKDSPTAASAKQAALNECGIPGCKVIIAYKNGCGATASAKTPLGSPNHVVGSIGDSPEEAEDNATAKCEQLNPGIQCRIWTKASCSYYE